MIFVAGNHIGSVHHAAGNRDLQETRPTYAFIPSEFIDEAGFAKSLYLASRWPSINASANPYAIGSHVLPDAAKPVSPRSRCPILAEFLTRLEPIAAVKSIKPTA